MERLAVVAALKAQGIAASVMKDALYTKLIVRTVEEWLERFGIKRKAGWSLQDLLVHYFNFRLKHIGVEEWKVHWSAELKAVLRTHPRRWALGQIAVEASLGMDINCYQSKEARNAEKDDDLLNDWQVHHLHLSTEVDGRDPRFMKRSDHLLFAYFKSPDAYFIDVTEHRLPGWGRKRLLEIMVDNWPEVMEPLCSGWLISPDLTDQEVELMRRRGYMCGVNIRGRGYAMVGHGFSSSGDNMRAIGYAHEVWRWAHANRDLFSTDPVLFQYGLKVQLFMD